MKTNVYIDGFNLFYGRLRGTPYKWLDLQNFCEIALPRLDINRILYFTALVHPRAHNPEQPLKQGTYLRALATKPKVEVHLGNFLTSVIRQPLVELDRETGRWRHVPGERPKLKLGPNGEVLHAVVLKTEEKGPTSISPRTF